MELSAFDRAIAIGALMGEERNLTGMGIVAASALNRGTSPSSFRSQSASLGDVFSAPHTGEAMLASVLGGVGLSREGRQYSASINANIKGASKEAYDAFERGIKAALGDVAALGPYAARYEKANVALDVAVKARDMGIDLGFGATNYGTRDFAQKAGVGKNAATFGAHSIGPFDRNETPPKQAEFASRFAAAAALTGVDIPESYRVDIDRYTTPTEISMAASVMQQQAQQHMALQGVEAFPGISYNDMVQPMGLSAVDVPNVSDSLGVNPVGEQGFANTYGITPDNYESLGLPDQIGTVEDLGALPDLSVSPSYEGFDIPASAGFSLPDQAAPNFDDVSVGSYPDITQGTAFDPMTSFNPVDAAPVDFSDVDVGSFPDITSTAYDPSSWSADFNPAPTDFSDVATPQPSGFHSGVDGWSAPETFGPDQHDQMAAEIANTKEQQGIARATNHATMSISPDIDALNDSLMAEIGVPQAPAAAPETAWGATPALAAPSLGTIPQGDIETPSTVAPRASAPAPVSSFTERAAAPRDTAPHDQFGTFGPTLSASEYANQVGSTFGVGKPQGGFMDAMANPTMANNYGSLPSTPDFGLGSLFGGKSSMPDAGFMDAMASPQHAAGYSPGIMDGWTGGALKGAAFGALTGGPFGALVGGALGAANLDGRLGAAFSNQFGNFTGFDGFDGYDFGTMNYGLGYNDRGERSPTGQDNSGNASVGDGSFGSQSGVNDNNPQGIL